MTTYTLQGNRIQMLCTDLHMAQNELVDALRAAGAEIKQSLLSQVENDVKGVSIQTLGVLAEVLQTSADYLIGLTDDPTPYSDTRDHVLLVEKDQARREKLQTLFSSIERLSPDMKAEYYAMLETLYAGVVARAKQRQQNPNFLAGR